MADSRASTPESKAVAEEVRPPDDVSSPDVLALAADFPVPDRAQWRELVATVLGKTRRDDLPEPVEAALRQTVGSGVEVGPLFDADEGGDLGRRAGVPGLAPFVRGRLPGYPQHTGWDVRARHAHPDVAVTRTAITEDLEHGVTSLWLVFGDGTIPAEAGPDVLSDVLLDVAPVVLQAGSEIGRVADTFLAVAADRGIQAAALSGNLGADPFGDALRSGSDPDLSVAVSLAGRCRDEFPAMRSMLVDGLAFHDRGAGVVEELGCSLAAGVGYLRALTGDGFDVDAAFEQLDFRCSATADQFLTIAALRAGRRLWNRVGEVAGASPAVRGQRQHAVTSPVMMTRRDPWVNMLRTTVACFAAGVGGAEAVTVLPFDTELGLPDAFARRIARNTQTLLMEEGHLARVLDPAGGSWYVESLTDKLATAAWGWFTEIERAGGLAAALADGLVAQRLASVWADRTDRLAHRTEPITGVSEFPNLAERLPERTPHPAVGTPGERAGLAPVRAATDFEHVRDRVDAVAVERDSRPTVFLARIGAVAASAPRASFAENLFQSGGLGTASNRADGGSGDQGEQGDSGRQVGDDDAAIVSAFTESGTTAACLCGTDEAYEDRAEALVHALHRAGARMVWLAGPPDSGGLPENRQESTRAGDLARIDGHVFAGCDALAVLHATVDELGVP